MGDGTNQHAGTEREHDVSNSPHFYLVNLQKPAGKLQKNNKSITCYRSFRAQK